MVSVPRQLLIQAIIILVNALFAAMEMAVISLNVNKLKRKVDEGDKSAEKLLSLTENPAGFLSTIQVGISLSGFIGAAFAADSLAEPLVAWMQRIGLDFISAGTLNTIAVLLITIILTLVTIIFGELIPKRIAQQKSYEVAKACLGVISVMSVIFRPAVWIVTSVTNLVLKIMHLKTTGDDGAVSEDDIRMMVDQGGDSGSIEADEKEMIQNIFEFNDQTVSEIMTRVSDVHAFSVDESAEEILRVIEESGNSRFPVYEEDINNVIGILNSRVFLINMTEHRGESVREMLRPAYFVPETIKADQLFSDMQKKKEHIAIVIDEYGETSGIVTLEDLLEEIVGNIYDEFDKQEAPEIEKLDENHWKVQGTLAIEDLEEALDVDIPDDREYDTVGGMIFSTLHTIPEDGQTFEVDIYGLHITVTKVEDKRIMEAEIEKKAPEVPEDDNTEEE